MYKFYKYPIIVGFSSSLLFFVASTLVTFGQPTLLSIADKLSSFFITAMIPLAIALLLLFFFWNIAVFLFKKGEYKKRAKEKLLWSIIGVAALFSLYSFILFLRILIS